MKREDARAAIAAHIARSRRRTRRDGTTARLVMEVLDMHADTAIKDAGAELWTQLEAAKAAYETCRADHLAAEERVKLAREALIADGYFTADQVGDDIAPRITEVLAMARGEVDAAAAEVDRLRESGRLMAIDVDQLTESCTTLGRERNEARAERDTLLKDLAGHAETIGRLGNENERLRAQLAAMTRPGPLPPDISGDLDAVPANRIAEPAPAAGDAPRKAPRARARRAAAKGGTEETGFTE